MCKCPLSDKVIYGWGPPCSIEQISSNNSLGQSYYRPAPPLSARFAFTSRLPGYTDPELAQVSPRWRNAFWVAESIQQMALTPAAAATQPPSNDVTKEVTVPRRRQLPVVQNFVITPVVTRDHQPGETQPRSSRADLWCRPQTINKPRERDPALITLLQCFQLQWYFSENSTHGKMENWNARQIF